MDPTRRKLFDVAVVILLMHSVGMAQENTRQTVSFSKAQAAGQSV